MCLGAELGLKDQDSRSLAIANQAFGLFAAANYLNADVRRAREIVENNFAPRPAWKWPRPRRQPFIEVDHRDAQPIVRLLPETFADDYTENRNE